jgi:hypothetical protein
MPTPSQDLATLASTLHAAGYAPVPVTTDKAPRDPETGVPLSWKSYQTAPPAPEQLAQWFSITGLG